MSGIGEWLSFLFKGHCDAQTQAYIDILHDFPFFYNHLKRYTLKKNYNVLK